MNPKLSGLPCTCWVLIVELCCTRLCVGADEAFELRRRGAARNISPLLQQGLRARPNLLGDGCTWFIPPDVRFDSALFVSAHLPGC